MARAVDLGIREKGKTADQIGRATVVAMVRLMAAVVARRSEDN